MKNMEINKIEKFLVNLKISLNFSILEIMLPAINAPTAGDKPRSVAKDVNTINMENEKRYMPSSPKL